MFLVIKKRPYSHLRLCTTIILWQPVFSFLCEKGLLQCVCTSCLFSPFFVGAIAISRSYVTTVWPVHIMDINCTGLEGTIWDCALNNGRACTRMQDASVQCQGEPFSLSCSALSAFRNPELLDIHNRMAFILVVIIKATIYYGHKVTSALPLL